MSSDKAVAAKDPRLSNSNFEIGDIVRIKNVSASWDVWKVIGRCYGEKSYTLSTFDTDEPAQVLEAVAPELLESAAQS